jgi:hypothetical protein
MLFLKVLKYFGSDNDIVEIDSFNILYVKLVSLKLLVKEISINFLLFVRVNGLRLCFTL